jgi:hypothetical protein
MMGNDYTPYFTRQHDRIALEEKARFGPSSALVEMPIHWSTDDSPHFEFVRTENSLRQGLRTAGDVLENWIGDFIYMKRTVDWGVMTYTCHPFIIGRGHRMLMLESLIHRVLDEGGEFQRVDDTAGEFRRRTLA